MYADIVAGKCATAHTLTDFTKALRNDPFNFLDVRHVCSFFCAVLFLLISVDLSLNFCK